MNSNNFFLGDFSGTVESINKSTLLHFTEMSDHWASVQGQWQRTLGALQNTNALATMRSIPGFIDSSFLLELLVTFSKR